MAKTNDTLLTEFRDEGFRRSFRAYFHELGISVSDWEGLFQEMDSDGRGNLCWLRLAENGEPVGFLQFCPMELTGWFFTGSFGFIREFWVAPEYRGQGHGTALLGLAEGYMRERGMRAAILTTDTAPEFYLSHGYRPAPEFEARNGDEVFVKTLE